MRLKYVQRLWVKRLTVLIFSTARVFTLVSGADLINLKRDRSGLLVVRHSNFPWFQQRCTLVRPGDGGFRIPSDATLENRIPTLRESGVLKDLFENRRRWITGSAGKSATLRKKILKILYQSFYHVEFNSGNWVLNLCFNNTSF